MRKIFVLLALLMIPAIAFAQFITSNYTEQGGARTVIGGSLDVVSGGEIDVESGASFKIAGLAQPTFRVAFDAIASGQTAKTVTVTGATASSRCVAMSNEQSTNAVYVRSAVPGTNQVVVNASADPGASNLDITVICAN